MALRISDSIKIGSVRVRVSAPLTGRGRPWISVGTHTGRRGWIGVSAPIGGRKRKAR